MRAFIASLIVAFVVLSVLADRGRSIQRIATGSVAEVYAGEWLSVASEGTRLQVRLTGTTSYEDDVSDIRPGARVTVWYRFVGERRPVADKVRLSGDASTLR